MSSTTLRPRRMAARELGHERDDHSIPNGQHRTTTRATAHSSEPLTHEDVLNVWRTLAECGRETWTVGRGTWSVGRGIVHGRKMLRTKPSHIPTSHVPTSRASSAVRRQARSSRDGAETRRSAISAPARVDPHGEDREQFRRMLDELGLRHRPAASPAATSRPAPSRSARLSVLVATSYVLGGGRWKVCNTEADLAGLHGNASRSRRAPDLIDRFLSTRSRSMSTRSATANARSSAACSNTSRSRIHSGDSAMTLPPYRILGRKPWQQISIRPAAAEKIG